MIFATAEGERCCYGVQSEKFGKGGVLHGTARTEDAFRKKGIIAILIAAALLVAAGVASKAAYADPLGELFANLTGQARAVYENHLETDTVTPSGTTINLFDYWDTVKNPDGGDLANSDPDGGINFDNQLKFTTGYGPWENTENINQYTTSEAPRAGMLVSTLQNGYPSLSGTSGLSWKGTNGDEGYPVSVTQESLAYLFDESEQDGKEAHLNVAGLLQVDEDGYYYYNSQENYAAYDEANNSFDVYDTPGVTQREFSNNGSITSSVQGMFFPFNSADDVFIEEGGELIEKEGVVSQNGNYWSGPRDTSLNHYFGLSMTTKFVQTTGGMTTHGNQPVTYEFSGDDDVWVFIDGVLVGDLGGIHDAASLKIDFSTGSIYINGALDGNLKQKIAGAGVDTAAENWKANTFADGTYHTLKFFYLERGNVASNMNLKFNLVSVPDSKVVKVDQQGKYLSGAGFALYATDDDYFVSGEPVASGTTGADGRLTLVDSMDALITFEDLVKTTGKTHFVLKETKTLTGYRKSDDMNIEYSNGAVYCTNHWATGAFANANEMITSASQMKTNTNGAVLSIDDDGALISSDENSVGSGGTLYAMVLHREPDTGTGTFEDATWKAVYGDVENGELELTGEVNAGTYAGIVNEMLTSHPENIYELKANAAGLYSVQIDALPGDIQKYYHVLGPDEKDQTEFAIAFYYVANGQTHRILDENTNEGGSYAFSRQFGATFYVPNIKNRISVQKVDDTGKTLEGATFGLYSSSDVTVVDGVATINEGAVPLETHETKNLTKNPTDGSEPDIIDLDGGVVFEGKDGILPTGEYYLAEIAAPNGYEVNKQVVKVVVDEQGVYAHAGVEGDGITVSRGVGTLVSTMKQFGTNDGIDSTLRDVTAQLQSCDDPTAGNVTWTNITGKNTVHYQYDPDNNDPENKSAFLEYALVEGTAADLTIDEGWSNLAITQCLDKHGSEENLHKQELGDQSLNALFSGFTNVIVANQRTGDLQIKKEVSYYDGIPSDKSYELRQKKFDFEIGLKDAKGSALSGTYNVTGLVVDGATVPSLTFKDGKASVKLAHNDTLTIQGLPIGTQYTITETLNEAGFATTGTSTDNSGVTFSDDKRTANGEIKDINPDAAGLETVLVSFNNKYEVKPTHPAKTISAQKILKGRNWNAADTFEFKLVELAHNPVKVLPDGSMTYKMSAPEDTTNSKDKPQLFTFNTDERLIFTAPGTYEFSLYEVQPNTLLPGVSYSQAEYRFTYVVEDVNSQLTITSETVTQVTNDAAVSTEVAWTEKPSFTNVYDKEAAEFTIVGTKYLTSNGVSETPDQGRFQFRLEPDSGVDNSDSNNPNQVISAADVPMPEGTQGEGEGRYYVTGNDSDSIALGPIAFVQNDANKTYVYRVYEVIDPEATNPSVLDQDGNKVAYKDVTDEADKQLAGWTYKGVTYDSTWYTVTVTVNVTMIGGALDPQVSFSTDEGTQNSLTFSNEYASAPVVGGPVGQKTLTGRAAGETFTFTLQADANDQTTVNAVANGIVVLAKSEGTDPVTSIQASVTANQLNVEDGTRGTAGFAFNNITFNKADTYRFTITENLPDGVSKQNPTKDGLTYDTFPATAAVTVGEKTDEATGLPMGELEIKGITYTNPGVPGGGNTEAKFVNTYNATGTLSLSGTKSIEGRSFQTGDSFTFALTSQEATSPMPTNSQVTITPESGNTASVSFGAINYTLNDVGQHVYTLEEVAGDTPKGLTYDATKYKVTVDVADAGNGTLNISRSIVKVADNIETAADSVAWTNVYAPASDTKAFAELGGTKVLTGREWTDADEFTFKLEGANDLTKAAIASGEITFKNYPNAGIDPDSIVDTATKGKVDFSFGEMTFTKATADGAPYVFKVTEVLPQDDDSSKVGVQSNGVTYDDHAHTVSVSVRDNLQGNLSATVHTPTTSNTWNNTYGATGELDGSAALKVSKNLVGRDWADGETFGFKIEKVSYKENAQATEQTDDATLAAMPAPAETTIQVGKGGGNFGNIAFTKAGIYTYKVSETAPAESETGMSYSNTVYTVTVTVTDNGSGALSAEAAYSGGATVAEGTMKFENALQTKSVKNSAGADINNQGVQVGDELTYTVSYHNNQDAASTVTITDGIPTGTQYVANTAGEGVYDDTTNPDKPKLTWTIENVQPNAGGSVSFKVKVTGAAVNTTIENTATVKIGDGPEISTNPVENPVGGLGNLTISKTVTVEPGQGLNEGAIKAKKFTFTVAFEAPTGTTLADKYQYEGANGAANGTIKTDGTGAVTLEDGQSVTIKDLPHGTKCTVTETDAPGFTTKVNGVDGKQATVVVSADPSRQAKAEFANHYKAGGAVLSGTTAPQVKKTLTGRDWRTNSDAFQFVVEKVSYNDDTAATTLNEMPDIAGATISDANKDALVPLGGDNGVTFSKTGTYVYKVSEIIPTDDDAAVAGTQKEGVTYDEHGATITITVTDTDTDGGYDGNLHASVSYDNSKATTQADKDEKSAAAFTNTYDAGSITLGGEGDAKIEATKTLTGRPQTAGEFTFVVTNALNNAEVVEGTTQADAADGAPAAVVFDSITYTSKSLQDDSEATPNANTKSVNGDGTVTYTYEYLVSEVMTDGLIASGVTPGTTDFKVKVKVTDNGKGELSIAVDYLGKDLVFTNTYGATAKADLPVKGYKKLTTPEGTGWNAPDITGKYTFTITCDTENAPMPANESVTNGEGGVIDFGSITYTMENVFGNEPTATSDGGAEQASATRTKTFVYTITESLTGDEVPGVSMDKTAKTFEVTVTDNGNGTLSASVKDTANQGFEFENKYTVEEEPSSLTGEGNFTLTKTLEGRAMTDGEFTFNLYEGENIVATGTNDANGNVEMDSVPFKKPGTYTYVLSEEPGEAGNGVTYDTAWYTVTATVTDNGDGTLSVAWSAKKGADGDEIAATEPIVFANAYEAKPASAYLVASKEYTGAQLKADQFTFQVLNEDGGVVAEAKNDAMGLVAFPVIDDLNAEGTYTYTISEVNDGQEGVTYDGAQHKATVTVTDEGTGHLTATVAYENGTAPVFANTYTEPEGPSDPGKPGKPEPPALADTSDKLGPLTIGLAVLAVAAGAGIAVAAVKMRRKAGTHHRTK